MASLHFVVGLCEAGVWSFSRPRALEFYRQGDFEQVIRQLSPILEPGNSVSKTDSVFAFRLLGVVYAADPKTRELGRHCWMNLLDREPKANLVDLFVGEELDHLWERTRLEHQARMAMAQRAQKDAAWMTQDDAAALQKLLEMQDEAMGLQVASSQVKPKTKANAVVEESKAALPGGQAAVSADIGEQENAETAEARFPFGNALDKDERPYWKRPGTWIAASMAAGVVGLTVYYTFGESAEPPQKLYHVPNETASAH
jgi:hypothetical protein